MKIIPIFTFLWLCLMLILFHIPGGPISEESRWLSSMIGLNEGMLRQFMYVLLDMVLAVLVVLGWPDSLVWMRCVMLGLIAVVDEWSKGLRFFSGRHCSVWSDMILNLAGAGIGVVIALLVGVIE